MSRAVLGLECTGETYAVGLLVDGKHQTSFEGLSPRRALRELPGHTGYLLKNAGLDYESIAAVGVTHGPGSFTGVRLGVTLARTVAFAAGCGVAAFDTLQVMAKGWAEAISEGRAAIALDARRKELYCGVFDLSSGLPIVETEVRTPVEFAKCLEATDDVRVMAGAGFGAYPDLVPAEFRGPVGADKRLSQPPVATLCGLTYKAWQDECLQGWGEVLPEYHRKADIQVSAKTL